MRKQIQILCVVGCIASFGSVTSAEASCTWSFNWYCNACAKIGGRTTGSQEGYATEAQCDSARQSVAREVTTGSCSSSGLCDTPAESRTAPGVRSPQGGGYQAPAMDYEAERQRAEEERMREEAADAERRARDKAERDRKQRQFMSEKLDVIKTLKGADFDGTRGGLELKGGADDRLPLKSSTETLGVKRDKSGGGGGEDRFSRGNKFTAPVDLSNKDPAGALTVDSGSTRELIPDGHLGSFVAGQPWPAHIKGQAVVALIDLERGRPERAAASLKEASKAQPNDEFLRRAAIKATEETKNSHLKFDPERLGKQLSKSAYHAYVAAWEELEKGNMNGAARLFGRALDAAPDNATLQQLVAETEKRRRILSPEEQRQHDRRMENARDYAQGNAALRLGLNAIHWNNALALNYLDEASQNLSGLDWEFIRITKQEVADHTHSDPGSFWKYRYNNRADAMLDALEYGKGDWAASLRYLKHSKQIQHNNKVVDDAYREIERLSKGSSDR